MTRLNPVPLLDVEGSDPLVEVEGSLAPNAALCGGGIHLRTVRYCPTCERRRRMVGLLAVWYPTHWTCCACGDSWQEGERMERPFARGWRHREAAKATRWWNAALPAGEALARFRGLLEAEFDCPECRHPLREHDEQYRCGVCGHRCPPEIEGDAG